MKSRWYPTINITGSEYSYLIAEADTRGIGFLRSKLFTLHGRETSGGQFGYGTKHDSQREMTGNQRSDLAWLSRLDTRTGKAYQIKLTLQRLWNYTNRTEAESFLKWWYFWATHSRLEPLIEAAKTIKRHWKGILQFVDSRITTGIVEGLNSKIKTAMKRAYRFKSFEYLRTVIYLVAGKINITLPTQC